MFPLLWLLFQPVSATASNSTTDTVLWVIFSILITAIGWLSWQILAIRSEHENMVTNIATPMNDIDATQHSFSLIEYKDIEDISLLDHSKREFTGVWRRIPVLLTEIATKAKPDILRQELMPLVKARHPHLVLFLGISCPSNGIICIVSERMDGGSLRAWLASDTMYNTPESKPASSSSWKDRITIAQQIAQGMNMLHQQKPHPIIHGKLSSLSVLLDDRLVAKVGGYGLSKIVALENNGQIEDPSWSAPEVLAKGGKATVASDIFSFGMVLFELFTRTHPFPKLSAVQIAREVTTGKLPPLPVACPAPLRDLFAGCWAADPTQRLPFSQILTALQGLHKLSVDVVRVFEQPLVSQSATNSSLVQTLPRPPIAGVSPALPASPAEDDLTRSWLLRESDITLMGRLGHGSFGEVYEGQLRGLTVAVKKFQLPTNRKGSRQQREAKALHQSFVRELTVHASLTHPHVVLFLNGVVTQHSLLIVMELCAKGSLADLLANPTEAFDWDRIMQVLLGVAKGLAYLHSLEPPMVHRDLRASNVLITSTWEAKVADFGMAGVLHGLEAMKSNSARTQNALYLAPECLHEEKYASPASDVYSFGLLVLEIFTRKKPFAELNLSPVQAALEVLSRDRRPDIPEYIPGNLRSLIEACWQTEPGRRPSMGDVVHALEAVQATGLPRLELTVSNAKLYIKKQQVHAFRCSDSIVVSKSWGVSESQRGDWVIIGPGHDVYTCAHSIFLETYEVVPGQPDPTLFGKFTKVLALEMKTSFLVKSLEGLEHGPAGSFLAQNPVRGEQYAIPRDKFLELYEPAAVQALEGRQLQQLLAEQQASASPGQGAKNGKAKASGSGNSANIGGVTHAVPVKKQLEEEYAGLLQQHRRKSLTTANSLRASAWAKQES